MPDKNRPYSDELISAYLDDELNVEERRQVEQWLNSDPESHQLMTQLSQLRDRLRAEMHQSPVPPLDASFTARVLARVHDLRDSAGSRADAPLPEAANRAVTRQAQPQTERAWRRGLVWATAIVTASIALILSQQFKPVSDRQVARHQPASADASPATDSVPELRPKPAPNGGPERMPSFAAKGEMADTVELDGAAAEVGAGGSAVAAIESQSPPPAAAIVAESSQGIESSPNNLSRSSSSSAQARRGGLEPHAMRAAAEPAAGRNAPFLGQVVEGRIPRDQLPMVAKQLATDHHFFLQLAAVESEAVDALTVKESAAAAVLVPPVPTAPIPDMVQVLVDGDADAIVASLEKLPNVHWTVLAPDEWLRQTTPEATQMQQSLQANRGTQSKLLRDFFQVSTGPPQLASDESAADSARNSLNELGDRAASKSSSGREGGGKSERGGDGPLAASVGEPQLPHSGTQRRVLLMLRLDDRRPVEASAEDDSAE